MSHRLHLETPSFPFRIKYLSLLRLFFKNFKSRSNWKGVYSGSDVFFILEALEHLKLQPN